MDSGSCKILKNFRKNTYFHEEEVDIISEKDENLSVLLVLADLANRMNINSVFFHFSTRAHTWKDGETPHDLCRDEKDFDLHTKYSYKEILS